jgi:hypothetical protein
MLVEDVEGGSRENSPLLEKNNGSEKQSVSSKDPKEILVS